MSDDTRKGVTLRTKRRLHQPQEAIERRRDARLKQRSLRSSLGPVIDLSRSGMRVLSPRKIQHYLELTIHDDTGSRIQLRARVVWCKRIGFRRHLAGLEFIENPEAVTSHLTKIVTTDYLSL